MKTPEKTAFIYKNVFVYRMLMQLLYKGQYKQRYKKIIPFLRANKITELCFGDSIIAEYCRQNNIEWTGYDINLPFVKHAKKNNLNAIKGDIVTLEKFEQADICLLIGSLYHFHESLEIVFEKMFSCAPVIIISEPIKNLTQNKGIIGKLAKGSSDINGLEQNFRFNEQTLIQKLEELSLKFNFKIELLEKFNKDCIIRLTK